MENAREFFPTVGKKSADFSNDWKNSSPFFQRLEKRAPSARKKGTDPILPSPKKGDRPHCVGDAKRGQTPFLGGWS